MPVALVVLSSETSAVEEGNTVQLTAETQNAGEQNLSGRAVTWSSSDDNVVQLSANGPQRSLYPMAAPCW